MEQKNTSIPKEKFKFVNGESRLHDTKLDTKPHSYFYDAFLRFCKNKGSVVGAVVIIFLILFAIIVPFCTQYTVAYTDTYYRTSIPRAKLFQSTSFWDGCEARSDSKRNFIYYFAMGEEAGEGHYAVEVYRPYVCPVRKFATISG